MVIIVYCDGLCEPTNPSGIATYGYVIYRGEIKLHEGFGVVGEGQGMSNNVAEYAALCKALTHLRGVGLENEEVIVKSDSKLLVNQMNGVWKKHNRGLYVPKYLEARALQRGFRSIRFEWVDRELNTEADALSRRAYEDHNNPNSRFFRQDGDL